MKFVLNNIRSAWNVGAIMRTADATDSEVIMIGYTPKPTGNTLKMIAKTAIGAENTVPWEHYDHWTEALEAYAGSLQLGIEISDQSQSIYDYLPKNDWELDNTILWFGNEISGLEKDLCERLDAELHLPMLGMKESINVASTVCTTAYLFRFAEHQRSVK